MRKSFPPPSSRHSVSSFNAVALPAQVTATLHHDLAISGWLCPVSGAQLAIDVHLVDEEPFHDIELDLQGRIGDFLLEGAANV